MMIKILFYFYHRIWSISLIFARFFKSRLPPKVQNYLEERELSQLVWRRPPRPEQRRIWFHAASGEIEYIRPLLRLWKQKHPEDLLFLTYFSTSARSMIRSLTEIDGWAPLPFDLPGPCEKFIKHLNPDILVIARTDLWPTLLAKMGSRPKILIASTWTEGSQKAVGAGRWMSLWCIKYLNKICVVSESDAAFLKTLKSNVPCSVTGDPRFDQVQFRLQQQRPLPNLLKTWSHGQSVVIAGSTWAEDEEVLLPSWKSVAEPGRRLLLVPHETTQEHLTLLTKTLTSANLTFTLWSECFHSTNPISTDILIFNQKGWLAELYQLADLAFIGGSFKKQVHSVMEALGCGLPVLVGPCYRNNREAIEFNTMGTEGTKFVEVVVDGESLAHHLKKHWQRSELFCKTLKTEIRDAFLARCNATEKNYEEIQACL